jgi:predicted aspartyl protease
MGRKPKRRWPGAGFVLALCLAQPGARASPCTLALNSQLKLGPTDGLIDARINNAPARLLLDTGAFTTILTAQAAKRLSLRADPDTSETFRGVTRDPWTLEGIGGARIGTEMMADRFELGALVGRHFHFLTAAIAFGAADGLLSTDFLSAYDVDLDFPEGQVRLYRTTGTCSSAKVYLQPPLYAVPLLQIADDPRPLVSVQIDGHQLVALIDTGADRSAIYRDTAAALGVQIEAPKSETGLKVHGVGPRTVGAVEHSFASLTMGELTFRNMRIQVLDEHSDGGVDMLLGVDFQRRLHLWISNSAHVLVAQYPPRPSPSVE